MVDFAHSIDESPSRRGARPASFVPAPVGFVSSGGGAPLSIGSLFTGIGGLDLGLERALGASLSWYCEREERPAGVLARRRPGATWYEDVTAVRYPPPVDVLCGGFPCQDVSVAGLGAGLDGARSGLWSEMARIIEEARPAWVVIENVAALLRRGLDRVLLDLDERGFDAEWQTFPALAVGAAHIRDRVFIVAWPRERGAFRVFRGADLVRAAFDAARGEGGVWSAEPDIPRTVTSEEMAPSERRWRLRALGNAVVPQQAQLVGDYLARAVEDSGGPGMPFARRDGKRFEKLTGGLFGWPMPYTGPLPRGGAMRGGVLYECAGLCDVPTARAWHAGPTVPTPQAHDARGDRGAGSIRAGGGRVGRGVADTPTAAARERPSLWPTPRSEDSESSGARVGRGVADTLTAAARERPSLWPTPTSGDSAGSGSRNTGTSKAHPGVSLTDAVRGDGGRGRLPLWSTPAAQDGKNDTLPPSQATRDTLPGDLIRSGEAGHLNPAWVEWLMGFPPGSRASRWRSGSRNIASTPSCGPGSAVPAPARARRRRVDRLRARGGRHARAPRGGLGRRAPGPHVDSDPGLTDGGRGARTARPPCSSGTGWRSQVALGVRPFGPRAGRVGDRDSSVALHRDAGLRGPAWGVNGGALVATCPRMLDAPTQPAYRPGRGCGVDQAQRLHGRQPGR